MIAKYDERDRDQFLGYIGSDWGECPYLYMNFVGLSGISPGVEAFICRSGSAVSAVMLRYYNALHIFSRERDLDANELKAFVADMDPMVIWINENAYGILKDILIGYCVETLPVMSCSSPAADVDTSGVEVATEADLPEIAELMLGDELYRSGYANASQIIGPFSERMRQGVGISYIVRIEGRLAAHISINAMASGIAVYGALVVGRQFRRQGLARKVRAKLMEDMAARNMTVLDFAISEATRKIDIAGGGKFIGNIIKLSKSE